jgi:hypothetical protein
VRLPHWAGCRTARSSIPVRWNNLSRRFARISLAAPSLDVDTTGAYAPDIAKIVAFVNGR